MKKTLLFTLVLSLLFLLAPLSVCAEEVVLSPEGEVEQNQTAESTAPTEDEAKTLTENVAAFIERNADEILSTLTLLSSLLIAFLYKSGLLPLLRNGISAISDTAGKTGKMAEEFTEKAKEELMRIRESTAPAADALKKTEEHLVMLCAALEKAEKDQKETKDILLTETSLFYELLASVNLPQAQKDSMTESYYRLRERLENKE